MSVDHFGVLVGEARLILVEAAGDAAHHLDQQELGGVVVGAEDEVRLDELVVVESLVEVEVGGHCRIRRKKLGSGIAEIGGNGHSGQ